MEIRMYVSVPVSPSSSCPPSLPAFLPPVLHSLTLGGVQRGTLTVSSHNPSSDRSILRTSSTLPAGRVEVWMCCDGRCSGSPPPSLRSSVQDCEVPVPPTDGSHVVQSALID
ncbi:hypothetical protein E2C01_054915 [Portunus trituberculatus]|uniref:Uncharacterized protein n=1 Tax=Portunus trituberculatus TaxID=210409 RepID=A0A5B7GTG6_PORTR|nr:hypothetical protein [Portunus trituberculatus]